MSLVGLAMDLLLACLLVAALMYGVRLERKLKGLRDSQAGFAEAVIALDAASRRAEGSLETLRAASEEAHDELHDRILKARELKQELEKLIARAERSAEAPPAPVAGRVAQISELEADFPARRAFAPSAPPVRPREPIAPPAKAGAARNLDEDLFETTPTGSRR